MILQNITKQFLTAKKQPSFHITCSYPISQATHLHEWRQPISLDCPLPLMSTFCSRQQLPCVLRNVEHAWLFGSPSFLGPSINYDRTIPQLWLNMNRIPATMCQ